MWSRRSLPVGVNDKGLSLWLRPEYYWIWWKCSLENLNSSQHMIYIWRWKSADGHSWMFTCMLVVSAYVSYLISDQSFGHRSPHNLVRWAWLWGSRLSSETTRTTSSYRGGDVSKEIVASLTLYVDGPKSRFSSKNLNTVNIQYIIKVKVVKHHNEIHQKTLVIF